MERKIGGKLVRRIKCGKSQFVLKNECAYDVPLPSLKQQLSNDFILTEVR